jgi:enterochelin esterase-like enzyme
MRRVWASFKRQSFRPVFAGFLLLFLYGCGAEPTPEPLPIATLPDGCTAPGSIVSADLPQPASGSPHSYRVYLPPCYEADTDSRYPVLYLIPGSVSSPDSWLKAGLAAMADRMILGAEVPPFIVIVTQNIDTDPGANVIRRELIPHIEDDYRVATDRRHRAVAGASLGGIAAYRLAFQYPEQFSSAGILGAGAIPGEEPLIRRWLAAMNDSNRVRVYLDTGDEDALMLERARAMQSLLDEAGIENRLYTGPGGHRYEYWVENFDIYFRWLAEDW